jgi:hypothetical protein
MRRSARETSVVQAQPREAFEGLRALVLQVFAGTLILFCVGGIKGRNDVGVISRERDVRFISVKSQEGELGSWWHNTSQERQGFADKSGWCGIQSVDRPCGRLSDRIRRSRRQEIEINSRHNSCRYAPELQLKGSGVGNWRICNKYLANEASH